MGSPNSTAKGFTTVKTIQWPLDEAYPPTAPVTMANPSSYAKDPLDLDFVDKSSLTYFIPRATDFAPDQVLKDGNLPPGQLLDAIEQRESLFFGESSPDRRIIAFSPCSYTDPR
jgi:hypothetical protein